MIQNVTMNITFTSKTVIDNRKRMVAVAIEYLIKHKTIDTAKIVNIFYYIDADIYARFFRV